MNIQDYIDPESCPEPKPALSAMSKTTRELHESIDARIRETGVPFLHPEDPTIQLDLLGAARMTAWQEGKAEHLFAGEGCWSELPQVYARYGVEATRELIRRIRRLESAAGVVLTDCGMQACALLFDILLKPNSHAILMRQVYNKTRMYLNWLTGRMSLEVTIVDDGDYDGIAGAIRENTALIFAETFTNPLMRALDPVRVGELVTRARAEKAKSLQMIVDDTIASPWGLKQPLLSYDGIDFVVASGTKSLSGTDRDLWGYIATNRMDPLNSVMDLQAARGGILDWRRAQVILGNLANAATAFRRRCEAASEVAAFLARHPQVSEVFHPSLDAHPDRAAIDEYYALPGSLLSFRLREADEAVMRHFCDVLAMCRVPRYALSFDGLATKINHHTTVSEYFTAAEELQRAGIDRLARLGVGIESPQDIIACLNWSLWHHSAVSAEEVARWQAERAAELGIYQGGGNA